MTALLICIGIFVLLLTLLAIRDLFQSKHAILRNFPVIGHGRYLLEKIGPELRQYIVADNNEELPFSRDERSWVYASSKESNNYFGFGTDNDLENSPGHLIIKQSAFPINELHADEEGYDPKHNISCAKILGAARNRKQAFRPSSIVNISAMSFGSLSAPAVESINRGCEIANCMQNTGEGGIASHHDHGGELIWQIGTGYYGCRNGQGGFDWDAMLQTVEQHPNLKAIEVKLSQGAKPGRGGILPAAKVTAEIAAIRGIPTGQSCISPAAHTVFRDVDSMLDFVEEIAERTGLPVGIKSAIGQISFWEELITQIGDTNRGVDFIAIDGGEGGTGAAPLVFTDHVSLPFKIAFSRVHKMFREANLDQDIVFIGSGKLGFPESALFAFGLGCDMINIAREAMMAIGCIQAQKCQTGHCPTGVATQNKWLMRGLDPTHKAARLANYVIVLRKEIQLLCFACGVDHPEKITTEHFELLHENFKSSTLAETFDVS